MTEQETARFIRLLGLARRAGYLALGTQAVDLAVRRGQAAVIVLASDAGPHTEEKILRAAGRTDCPVIRRLDRRDLASAVGKPGTVTVAVTDARMAEGLRASEPDDTPEPKA